MAPAASGLTPRADWWPLAGLVALAAALPATATAAWELLGDPAPRSLAAGVPVVAAVWAWLRLRVAAPRAAAGRRFGGIAVLVVAAGLSGLIALDVAPAQRLLLLAPLAVALVLAHGGFVLLRHLAGPLVLLLLAWPWPHDLVSDLSTPPLLALGGDLGAALAGWAGATISPATQPGQWRLLTPEGVQLAGLDASCSGASGLMALLVLAVPVLALWRSPPLRAGLWLGAGLLVVLLGNALRIGLLFWLAGTRGFDAVFTQVHVHAGAALVLLTWAGMLAALPLLGPGRPAPVVVAPPPPRGALPLLACLPGLVMCAVLDLNSTPPAAPAVEAEPEPLVERAPPPAAIPPEPSPPPPPPVAAPPSPPVVAKPPRRLPALELLPAVPGWTRWAHGSFPWAAGMFGAEARLERLVYQRGAEGRLLWIDVLVCPQVEAIDRHTVAGCFGSHAYTVERSEGAQIAGSDVGLWVVGDTAARRWAVAAWTQAAVPLAGEAQARRTMIWRRVDRGNGDAELGEVETLAGGLLAPPRKRPVGSAAAHDGVHALP